MILGGLVIFAGTLFGRILPAFRYLLAFIPIFMGLIVLEVISLKLPALRLNQVQVSPKHAARSYTIGLVFSLAVLPCATPILSSILAIGSLQGGMFKGAGLLAAFGAGISVPVVIAGTFFGFISSFNAVSKFWPSISKLSGLFLIVLGLYLLWKV